MYETAIAELRITNDPGVEGLIARFTRHQADVIAALADEQDAAFSSLPKLM